jgi:hypothetical protein
MLPCFSQLLLTLGAGSIDHHVKMHVSKVKFTLTPEDEHSESFSHQAI